MTQGRCPLIILCSRGAPPCDLLCQKSFSPFTQGGKSTCKLHLNGGLAHTLHHTTPRPFHHSRRLSVAAEGSGKQQHFAEEGERRNIDTRLRALRPRCSEGKGWGGDLREAVVSEVQHFEGSQLRDLLDSLGLLVWGLEFGVEG